MPTLCGVPALGLVFLAGAGWGYAQMPDTPLRTVKDPGVITTRQNITPAGAQSVFSGRVQGVAFGAKSSELWVLNSGQVFHMDWASNQVLGRVALHGDAGMQGIRYDSASQSVYVAGTEGRKAQLTRVDAQGKASVVMAGMGKGIAGSPAYSPKSHLAVVPLTGDNKLAVVDALTDSIVYKIDTGMVPFAAVMNGAGTVAYVSNWGGRRPLPGDVSGASGYGPDADRIVVDPRGIASSGTVTRVDLVAGRSEREIPAGLHPTALVLDEAHARLYVANGNADSVTVIDTATDKPIRTIQLDPFRERVGGIAPTALALSPDGGTLYVACGGINAIAAVQTATGRMAGLIPTAWYPSGLAISPDAKYLAVSTLLGIGAGSNGGEHRRYSLAARGSVAVIEIPGPGQLASYSAAVAENNRLPLAKAPGANRAFPVATAPVPIPLHPGQPSSIENVVFIIKENRTYDQVLGDMKKGNGDPSLVMFGADVTPNQHKIADQFVLLDNLYASGGNSADGHQWLTQANETDYVLWPGYLTRSYPFDGSDPVAYSSTGFLWDAAIRKGKTVRVYGEYAGMEWRTEPNRASLLQAWKDGQDLTHTWNTVAPLAPLNKLLASNYPAYTLEAPDVVRASIFLADLKKWVAGGRMPNLCILALPSNHTYGAMPGTSTPKAMVADNDLALGQIVEGLSRSPFWNKMAVFVVEDDAQDGVDHVDGHRTAAFVASPYARRGAVDSTFYSQQSILKTIEAILGLPNLTIFDRIAIDMRASFQNEPDFAPFTAEIPKQSLYEVNPHASALRGREKSDAIASSKMRWDVPDAAPTEKLNRILWRQIKGSAVPYPKIRQSVFSPYAVDVDDDEREGKKR